MEKSEQDEREDDIHSQLPQEYKSCFTLDEAKQRMREMGEEGQALDYNEAKIHYMPGDILGVFVLNDPESLEKGAVLQKQLATRGIHVPLTTYQENRGSIKMYKNAQEVSPHPLSRVQTDRPHIFRAHTLDQILVCL